MEMTTKEDYEKLEIELQRNEQHKEKNKFKKRQKNLNQRW